MKRRELFKMLGALAAVPVVAPLVALCKPKPAYDQTFYIVASPIAAHGNETLSTMSFSSANLASELMFSEGDIVTVGDYPRYHYISSIEPSPAEKAIGIIEKRIYGSSI